MILGSKPLIQMSVEEMHAAIEELRSAREALRNEAIKDKAIREAKGMSGEPRQPRAKRVKQPDEADMLAAEMMKMLRGEA